ncbi:MAG: membrane protein insertase YidC [Saprospiraceae bacterium]|nr:membrane protein insertase YidC [Saprospiraceae bacterium]
MDRNSIIGFILIFVILIVWNQYFFQPYIDKENTKKVLQDSLARVGNISTESNETISAEKIIQKDSSVTTILDTNITVPSREFVLENELIKIQISNKGAKITSAELKKYSKIITDKAGVESKIPLMLLNHPKNQFHYEVPIDGQILSTKNLQFSVQEESKNKLTLRAALPKGGELVEKFILDDSNYKLEHSISVNGTSLSQPIKLHWENYLDRIEKNVAYEKMYSTVYFKASDAKTDYCSCSSDDTKELPNKKVDWISHSHQFFNSTLMSAAGFSNVKNETHMMLDNAPEMKLIKSDLEIESELITNREFKMQWYIGPNEYNRLNEFKNGLADIISYGWSIFGTINRYAIRPLFVALESFIGSKGIIILLMTFLVKLLVFPLAYKMIQSQAKMSALKPEIDKIKSKYKDDLQKQQMETMKIYNEFGVNPLGGCFPLLLQMPIWIALYRFFPATIEFRQESFLWASDLTSYDIFMNLPFSLPFFGDTISLFAFLWMISTLVFTFYSSKSMDFSANPAMLYMQYLMPVIFWVMFNKTASGLTCYMFFSNLLNITQTILGKNYLFDQNKIRAQLEVNKAKPKKQGGFQQRLEQMVKDQQKIQQDKSNKKK